MVGCGRGAGRVIGVVMAVAAIGIVAACGPVYETRYQFTPPKDGLGRQLVGQCRQTQLLCEQNCELRERACRADARARGMMEYHLYVERRRREKAEIKRTPESFIQDWSCGADACVAACGAEYRNCYTDAGGEVTSSRVCVALCDMR